MNKDGLRRLLFAAGMLWALAGWARDGSDWALEVLFVSGGASWSAGDAAPRALTQGTRLPAGARIETGADGHAYFATVDKGFLALRPGSALRVAHYVAAPASAAAIRLELERGVARIISGTAAKARPDRFRLETPAAAIGVRGTDFSVRSDDALTQVAVRAGGVVVSPLAGACRAGGLGPCEGPLAAELFARDGGLILEVRRGSDEVLRRAAAGNGPDGAAPPRLEEEQQLAPPAQSSDGATLSPPLAEVRGGTAVATMPAPTVFWGRWAGDPARFNAITEQGQRAIVAVDSWFLVARNRETPTLPRDGRVSLALGTSEALIVSPNGGLLAPATVDGGHLTLDFGAMRFDTRLYAQGGGYQATINAVGAIDPDGLFHSQWLAGTNAVVRGAIEPNAGGAAYLFRHPINNQAEITGVTQWRR
ncbi:MAG: hypothetical protein B7X91_12795 [Hydrogenophilales bacterium 17-64-11]|nr:MAG: hypothetical protein B7X91_12795 [Hydrogenophilales bacterium 17-64-11]